MSRYRVPDRLLQPLIQNALSRPDPKYMDAMGQNPVEQEMKWVTALTRCVDQIATEAWAAGATWGLEHNTKPIRAIITPEQYQQLAKGIHDYVEEAANGEAKES